MRSVHINVAAQAKKGSVFRYTTSLQLTFATTRYMLSCWVTRTRQSLTQSLAIITAAAMSLFSFHRFGTGILPSRQKSSDVLPYFSLPRRKHVPVSQSERSFVCVTNKRHMALRTLPRHTLIHTALARTHIAAPTLICYAISCTPTTSLKALFPVQTPSCEMFVGLCALRTGRERSREGKGQKLR